MKAKRPVLKSFRARFWIFFAVLMVGALGGGLIGLAGATAILYFLGVHRLPALLDSLRDINLFALGLVVFNLVVAVLVVFLCKVHVGDWGIRSFDFWGRYHEVGWDEMTEFRSGNMLGLRYLRVRTADRSATLWLPLFLVDQVGFHEIIREQAGANHPLVIVHEHCIS